MKNKLFYFLCFLLFATPSQAKLFELSEFVLPNQMRLIVIPNHKAPIVKHMVWYKVGAVDEEIGKGGSAHLLEHLMFRGSKNIKGADFNQILQTNGAESNAFTSQDFTAYHQNLDISRLELAMFLEADRMKNLVIQPQDFEVERAIVFQERQQVVENNPFAPFIETMRRGLWQEHPYSRPISGTQTEILDLELDDVLSIYNKYYLPNNAVLIISGDIEPEKAYDLAVKYYGQIPTKNLEKEKEWPKIIDNTKLKLNMKLPRVEMARIIRNYAVPSFNSDKQKIYAYMLLSQYLGESETSELYKKLVIEQKLAVSVSSSYSYAARGMGNFEIAATPRYGVETSQLQLALDAAVVEAIQNLDAKKLELVKNKRLAGLVYLKDNPFDAAYIVGQLASVGMSKEEIENYPEMIKKVSLKEVKAAAEQLFEHSAMIDGVVEPLKGKQ